MLSPALGVFFNNVCLLLKELCFWLSYSTANAISVNYNFVMHTKEIKCLKLLRPERYPEPAGSTTIIPCDNASRKLTFFLIKKWTQLVSCQLAEMFSGQMYVVIAPSRTEHNWLSSDLMQSGHGPSKMKFRCITWRNPKYVRIYLVNSLWLIDIRCLVVKYLPAVYTKGQASKMFRTGCRVVPRCPDYLVGSI
jgi:hypothetical protein